MKLEIGIEEREEVGSWRLGVEAWREVMEERLGVDGGGWRRGLVLEAWNRWRVVEERLGVDGGEAWSLRLL